MKKAKGRGIVLKKICMIFLCLLCGVSSVLYGLSVKMIGTGTRFYIVWLLLGFLFFLLAYAVKKEWFSKLPSLPRKIILWILSIGFLCFFTVEGLIIGEFKDKGEPGLDYIVVLGAQVRESGPSIVLKYRLDTAIDYLEANPGTTCIVSGGQGYNEPFAEAVGMADYLMNNGIPEERIILESESTNTEENIIFSKKLITENSKVGIVTNNFHVFRALQCARKYGLGDACGIAAGTTPLYLPNNMFREFFGEIKFLLF